MNLKKKKVNKEKIRRVGEILDEFLIGNLESEFPVGGPSKEPHGAAEPELPVGAPLEPREVVEQARADVEEQQAGEEAEDEAYDETRYYFDLSEESHVAAELELPAAVPPEEPRAAAEQKRDDVEEQQADVEPEDEAYDQTKYYFDLADVEYCVDVAITEMIKENLVPGYNNPKKPPTLSEMFQDLFGENHKLTKQVEQFEEYISGYEDQVHIDDLQEAHKVMSEIIKELEDWGGKQSG